VDVVGKSKREIFERKSSSFEQSDGKRSQLDSATGKEPTIQRRRGGETPNAMRVAIEETQKRNQTEGRI